MDRCIGICSREGTIRDGGEHCGQKESVQNNDVREKTMVKDMVKDVVKERCVCSLQ